MSIFNSARLIGARVSDLMSSSDRRPGVAAASLDFAPHQGPAGIPDPEENGSGATTAGVGASGDQRINGLLSGIRWAGSITYSDPNSAADYQAGHPEAFTNFQQINAAQLLAAHAALDNSIFTQPLGAYSFSVEGFTNLSINYAGSGTGAGTIRLANTDDPSTAYAYYPDQRRLRRRRLLRQLRPQPDGGELRLPRGHPRARPFARAEARPRDRRLRRAARQYDSLEYSVMTYRTFIGDSLTATTTRLGARPDLHDARHPGAAAHVRCRLHP